MSDRPLEGIKVVDLSRVLAGPYATMMMADLGAEVVKVEPPWGDDTRTWGPPWVGDESAYYLSINRGKRSVVLDLRRSGDRDHLLALVDDADVMVESFRTGQLEGFGLGYAEVLAVRNPRLVFASLSAFGRTGPGRDLPGYATLIEARSGFLDITGEPEGPPTKMGVALVDILAGCHLMHAVSTALYERERTGSGRRIDVSLFESAMSALVNVAGNHLMGGVEPKRVGNTHPTVVPFEVFPTADRDVMVTAGNDTQFGRLCDLLGRPDLASDPRFVTNGARCEHRVALRVELVAAFKQRTSAEWIEVATAAGVPVGPINTVSEAFADPLTEHHELIHEVEHPRLGTLRTVRHPVRYDGKAPTSPRPSPQLGEHNEEILADR